MTARGRSPPHSSRLWFIHQLDPQDCSYNMHRVLRVRGALDIPRLRRALELVQARHEALRTSFPAIDGQPRQEIAPPGTFDVPVVELAVADAAEQEARLRELLLEAVRAPFDLATGPVMRALVVRLAAADHVVAVMLHHITGDDWSLRILNEEIAAAYAGEEGALPPLPVQYVDFTLWQKRWLESGAVAAQLDYWRRHLAGAPQLIDLLQGRKRPAGQVLRGARHIWRIEPGIVARLDALAQSERATPFMLSLAAFVVLLQRYSRGDDIVIGTPISGRPRPETQRMIGYFANTLALRTDASGDPSFTALLQRVRNCVLDSFANQDAPFEKVVDSLGLRRSRSHGTLFQVLFTHRHGIGTALDGSGLELSPIAVDDGVAKCDLWLAIEDGDQGRQAMLEVDAALFDDGAAVRMADISIACWPRSRRGPRLASPNSTSSRRPSGRCSRRGAARRAQHLSKAASPRCSRRRSPRRRTRSPCAAARRRSRMPRSIAGRRGSRIGCARRASARSGWSRSRHRARRR